MKKLILVLVLAGSAAGGFFWWRNSTAADSDEKDRNETEAVARGEIRQEVDCVGRVVSNRDVEIKCRASGEILRIPYDVSDAVKKDDILLELDERDQERTLRQSKAALAAAEARLAQSKSNLLVAEKTVEVAKMKAGAALESAQARVADSKSKSKRQEELFQKKFSSPEQYETSKTTAVQAEQDLLSARANVEDVKSQELALESRRQDVALSEAQAESSRIACEIALLQLSYTKVKAPLDGVISKRTVQVGQIISSGVTNIGGGTTAMILSDLSHLFVYASVDESKIGEVQLGQPVVITTDAFPDVKFLGKVERIGTTGLSVQAVVTFEVRIEVVDENKKLLKPEMTANVTITTAEKKDVLVVSAANISRNRSGNFVTLVQQDGTQEEKHPVKLGISDGNQTEIVEGLSEGDLVLVRRAEDESRWRGVDNPAMARRMQERVMMRTLGGGGSRGGSGGRGGGGGGR